ncbi:hypothetical protein ACJX0J_016609, partial [Zea mays]
VYAIDVSFGQDIFLLAFSFHMLNEQIFFAVMYMPYFGIKQILQNTNNITGIVKKVVFIFLREERKQQQSLTTLVDQPIINHNIIDLREQVNRGLVPHIKKGGEEISWYDREYILGHRIPDHHAQYGALYDLWIWHIFLWQAFNVMQPEEKKSDSSGKKTLEK